MLLVNENIGEKIYMTKGCYDCHGTKGIGQTSKRDLMIPFAKALSKKEIEEVSKYLSLINTSDKGEDIADEYLGGFGS